MSHSEVSMSFFHYTLVGHFDVRHPEKRSPVRPIDLDRVNWVLAEYPREVAALVQIQNGCARCQWAPAASQATGRLVYQFAYRLAQEEGCMAAENGRRITYPPEATAAQDEFLRELQASVAARRQ